MRRGSPTPRAAVCALACLTLLVVAGCGDDEDFANNPRPAAAVQLSGVITNSGVTISPDRRAASGPVTITISNQTDDAHTVTLEGDTVRETVGPINPMDTATLQKTLSPGTYEVRAGSERAVTRELSPATIRVADRSANSSNQVLLP